MKPNVYLKDLTGDEKVGMFLLCNFVRNVQYDSDGAALCKPYQWRYGDAGEARRERTPLRQLICLDDKQNAAVAQQWRNAPKDMFCCAEQGAKHCPFCKLKPVLSTSVYQMN